MLGKMSVLLGFSRVPSWRLLLLLSLASLGPGLLASAIMSSRNDPDTLIGFYQGYSLGGWCCFVLGVMGDYRSRLLAGVWTRISVWLGALLILHSRSVAWEGVWESLAIGIVQALTQFFFWLLASPQITPGGGLAALRKVAPAVMIVLLGGAPVLMVIFFHNSIPLVFAHVALGLLFVAGSVLTIRKLRAEIASHRVAMLA